jgi:hypothetical protein
MSGIEGVIRFTNKYCYLVFFLSACQFVKEHFEHKAQREILHHEELVFEFSNSSHSQGMVELSGIEPLTSCVQGRRSPS